MDLNDMTKEQLIEYIHDLEKKRAFSYEDQLKLLFLDASPFTMWASDRDCTIKFWAGQCENLYGFKKEDAIGKDFVELFVAPDEQKAAREDQISIIDDGAIFHNIANDRGKNGNTLRLLTNCWRLKVPDSNEYWNIEMGLIIDFFNQEVERLEQIIAESRALKAKVTQFIEYTKQYRQQFSERRKSLRSAIQKCDSEAIRQNKRRLYVDEVRPIRASIDVITERFNELIDKYSQLIKECGSSEECEECIDQFNDDYEDISFDFNDLVMNFQEISHPYTHGDLIVGLRDTTIKLFAERYAKLYSSAQDIKNEVLAEIDEYKSNISTNMNNEIAQEMLRRDHKIDSIVKGLRNTYIEALRKVNSASSTKELIEVQNSVETKYSEFQAELDAVKSGDSDI